MAGCAPHVFSPFNTITGQMSSMGWGAGLSDASSQTLVHYYWIFHYTLYIHPLWSTKVEINHSGVNHQGKQISSVLFVIVLAGNINQQCVYRHNVGHYTGHYLSLSPENLPIVACSEKWFGAGWQCALSFQHQGFTHGHRSYFAAGFAQVVVTSWWQWSDKGEAQNIFGILPWKLLH